MVVMPMLLTSRASIDEQVKQLEVHHLASRDGDLCFALLSDWVDCATQTDPATTHCCVPQRTGSQS